MIHHGVPIPLYYQIELQLRHAIEAGQYPPGHRLPTEGELQRAYGVSRVTVRTALQHLEEDGLISIRRGRGTFVERQALEDRKIERNPAHLFAFEEEVQKRGLTLAITVLSVEPGPVPERIARLLDLPVGSAVLRVRRIGWAGDAPLWTESRYFPPRVSERLQEDDYSRASIGTLLQALTGFPVTSTRLHISAGPATADQAERLQIALGDAVLINEFASYDTARQPVMAARAVFRADRYAFTFTMSSALAPLNHRQHAPVFASED
jgi:GntR family transcriptional regulator